MGDGSSVCIEYVGEIGLLLQNEKESQEADNSVWIRLTNVLYIEESGLNLLSMNALDRHNVYIVFRNGRCNKFDTETDAVLGNGFKRKDGLYQIRGVPLTATGKSGIACLDTIHKPDTVIKGIDVWHKRFGHAGKDSIGEMNRKGIVTEIDLKSPSSSINCVPCAEGKKNRSSMKGVLTESNTEVAGTIFTDLCRPMPVESWSKGKYFIHFVDAKSRHLSVSILPTKEGSEVLSAFRRYHSMFERQFNVKVKGLHSDNGREYANQEFSEYCSTNGIIHTFTAPCNPQ